MSITIFRDVTEVEEYQIRILNMVQISEHIYSSTLGIFPFNLLNITPVLPIVLIVVGTKSRKLSDKIVTVIHLIINGNGS